MSHLIAFYRGQKPDAEGRTLAEVQAFSDVQMEAVHDFIQWVFPLREPSRFNPDAPLVTEADIAAFREDPTLLEALKRSFERFLGFLGLKYEAGRVAKAANFDAKADVWRYPNHNWLRITRVLASTRMLGLEPESQAFFAFLRENREKPGSAIDDRTFRFWSEAAGEGSGPTRRPSHA